MKRTVLIITIAIASLSFTVSKLIPSIEFQIDIVNGNTNPSKSFLINGTSITSSSSPNNVWTAFVDESYSGVYGFQSGRSYIISTPNSLNALCISFKPTYRGNNHPDIQYDVIQKRFNVINAGSECTISSALKLNNKWMACPLSSNRPPALPISGIPTKRQ